MSGGWNTIESDAASILTLTIRLLFLDLQANTPPLGCLHISY